MNKTYYAVLVSLIDTPDQVKVVNLDCINGSEENKHKTENKHEAVRACDFMQNMWPEADYKVIEYTEIY